MFALTENHEGLTIFKHPTPAEFNETIELNESDIEACQPPLAIRRSRLKRRRYTCDDFASRLKDASLVTELSWNVRNPGDPSCPRSRRELRQRLGLSAPAQEKRNHFHEDDYIYVEGIGRMALSDESGGEDASSEGEGGGGGEGGDILDWKEQEEREHMEHQDGYLTSSSSSSSVSFNTNEAGSDIEEEEEEDLENENDPQLFGPGEDDLKLSLGCRHPTPRDVYFWDNTIRHKKSGKTRKTRNVKKRRVKIFRSQTNAVNTTQPGNTTSLIRNPTNLAQTLLFYLTRSALARHEFTDAVQLMSLYLISFNRPSQSVTNVTDFRLFKRFFSATPDVKYCDIYLDILRQIYGHPTFLRSDIIYDMTSIYCARKEPLLALEFLKRISGKNSATSPEPVADSIHSCAALAIYALWLLGNTGGGRKNLQENCGDLLKRLREGREMEHFRRELENATTKAWEKRRALPTLILRLICSVYLDKDIDRVLYILEDNLSVIPCGLDLLEMKMILLQVTCTLRYIDFSRGEPASLTLAMQSFDTFPLIDRVRCLFLFLKSNIFFGTAWRALVDETAGFLGRESRPDDPSSAMLECLAIWRMIDNILGPLDKVELYRSLFDARRSSINQLRAGDRILLLLVSPFFVSQWEDIIQLAHLISNGFKQRIRRNATLVRGASTVVEFNETYFGITCLRAIEGFERACTYLSSARTDDSNMINKMELGLLTEVSLTLNPRPTIRNTTGNMAMMIQKIRGKQE